MTPGRSVVELRLNYDRADVTVDELRSPESETLLAQPRPLDADRKHRILDEHPEQYEIDEVAWDLPIEDTVRFATPNGGNRDLKVENILCIFASESYPDQPDDTEQTTTGEDGAGDGDGDADAAAPDEAIDEAVDDASVEHRFVLEVRETREVQVAPDRFTGYQKHPETRRVTTYEEGPIRCSCGYEFTDTTEFREHVREVFEADEARAEVSGPYNNSLTYYDESEGDDAEADEEPAG